MLAYVFWHWKQPDIATAAYEALLTDFLSALTGASPPGLLDARSFAISGAPWAAGGAIAWEDWYRLGGSADLDQLNQAAVTASRQIPHDRVAAKAGGGTAGLYLLRRGAPPPHARHACWFGKPAGMSYAQLFAALDPLCQRGAALWGRQMVLGPTPEFCLHAPAPTALPEPLEALHIPLRCVWP